MADTRAAGDPGDSIHHEESDIRVGPIFKVVGAFTVLAAVIHVIIWFLMGYFESEAAKAQIQYPLAIGQQDRTPPEPRLQVDPRLDLDTYRAREQELLDHYRWVDKAAGTVRIPVSKAMELVVEQGLPTRSAQESAPGK